MYEEADKDTTIGVDDIAASMMVAYHAHTGQADSTGYNLGRAKPYQFRIYAANEPAARMTYKQHSISPALLAQRQ